MKYHSSRTEIDGIIFDSKAESRRYQELKLMEQSGAIRNLKLQPEFELLPAFEKNGKKHRAVKYRADFSYIEGNRHIVEDVKGFVTDVYKLKKKLFEYRFPDLTIKEVKR